MRTILTIILLVTAFLLMAAILLQQKGSGLSGVFGGDSASYLTKRGAEKFLTIFTILSAAAFISSALLLLILK